MSEPAETEVGEPPAELVWSSCISRTVDWFCSGILQIDTQLCSGLPREIVWDQRIAGLHVEMIFIYRAVMGEIEQTRK